MASSDESVDHSPDSEAIETEIEYDLEVEGSPHSSDQDDPYQSETKEFCADEPLADEQWLAHYEEEMKMECKLEKKKTNKTATRNSKGPLAFSWFYSLSFKRTDSWKDANSNFIFWQTWLKIVPS